MEEESLSRTPLRIVRISYTLSICLLISVAVREFLNEIKTEKSLMAGASILSQALTSILLGIPILRASDRMALMLVRASSVTTAVTGVFLLLIGLFEHQASLPFGFGLLLFSCISLMASFWQPARNIVEPTSNVEQLQVPLLADSFDDMELGLEEFDPTEASTSTGRLRGTRRLLQLARPQLLYLYAGCIVLLIRLPFSLAIPHFVSTTLGALAREDFTKAQHEIFFLLLLGSIDAALDFWCIFLFGYANQRIVRGVRLDLFSRILRMEIGFFDVHSSGELASRLNSDCSEMAGDLTWFFRFSIESVVRITGITAYMLIRCPTLGVCALSIIPVVAAINKCYGNWLSKNASQVQDALAAANVVAQEALANVRTVIGSAAEEQEQQRYEEKIQRQYSLNIRQLYMTGIYYMGISTFLINTIVQAALLWVGSNLIAQGRLTAEILLAFMLYQGQLQSETMNLFQSYTSLIKSSGAGDKVFALLDRSPPPPGLGGLDASTESEPETLEASNRGFDIELKNIRFRYPTRLQDVIFDDLNLSIPAGKTIALVGGSGCGKTTIVNLLQRFYDPDVGSVLVDGRDLREINLAAYRRQIGVVTQDPTLFDGTILDNITYGSPDISREEAIEAARVAHAHVFCEAIGYDTMVGERGVTLSGGQRQRIVLARAIVRKPRLLLLDEATSALDTESERLVQKALDALTETSVNTTTVVIAHRLRTVRKADQILVISHGKIIEAGNHEQLMEKDGEYAKMIAQANDKGVFT